MMSFCLFSLLVLFVSTGAQFIPPIVSGEEFQWLYFQFHSDSYCSSFIDYVHGVRVNECQRDPMFYAFWTNSSDFNTDVGSYRVKVEETVMATDDDISVVDGPITLGLLPVYGAGVEKTWTVSMVHYQTSDCTGEAEFEIGENAVIDGWQTTDECFHITNIRSSLRRYGRSVVLDVAEGSKTPQIIRFQQQNTAGHPSARNHLSKT